jgi:hypothetical protein
MNPAPPKCEPFHLATFAVAAPPAKWILTLNLLALHQRHCCASLRIRRLFPVNPGPFLSSDPFLLISPQAPSLLVPKLYPTSASTSKAHSMRLCQRNQPASNSYGSYRTVDSPRNLTRSSNPYFRNVSIHQCSSHKLTRTQISDRDARRTSQLYIPSPLLLISLSCAQTFLMIHMAA